MDKKTVTVPTISCGHCVNTIEREIGALDGVSSVAASFVTREVTVEWDGSQTDWDRVASRLDEIHFPVAG